MRRRSFAAARADFRAAARAGVCAAARAGLSAFHVALQGRAAPYFLCLGKESRQRKPRPRRRSAAPTALCCSGTRAGLQTRALRALRQAGPQPLPRPLRCAAPSRAVTTPSARCTAALRFAASVFAGRRCWSARGRRRGAGQQRGCAGRVFEPVARRSRDRASFAHGPLVPCSAREAGAQRRPDPCGRLSLVTFFGEAKKVTGPAP